MSKYLILGSNSFAGSSFVNFCVNNNHEVVGINRSDESSNLFLPVLNNPNKKKYIFHKLDINKNINDILEIIEQLKPDYIVDFAGQGMVAESWQNPHQWYQTNIVSKAKIHRFLINKSYLKRYVRISTPEVYGSNDELIDETFPMNPSTPYAISHMATDLSIISMYKNFSFPASIGRFANFYGAHQQLYRIVPKTIISILNNDILDLHGGGKSVRAFIHSDDVSSGIMKIIDDGKIGEVYHFSPNDFYTIKDLVILICNELNADFEKHTRIAPDRTAKDYAYLMSSKKSISELKWQCKVDIKEGINQTIDWVKANLEEINRLSHKYNHKE